VSIFISDSENTFGVSTELENPVFVDARQNTLEELLIEENNFFSMEKERIQFLKGKQKEFILEAKKIAGKSWATAGEFFSINNNTFQSYWKERTRLSKKDFEKICFVLKLNQSEILEKYQGKEYFWDYKKQIVEVGFANFGRIKKLTKLIELTFSNNYLVLNCSVINFSRIDIEKKIILPKEITPLLAEEIGLSIGDGYISNKKFEYRLKGNKNDEKEYYNNYVKPMFKELYNIDLNISEYDSTVGFEIYSKALWEFKTKVIGLPIAPKNTIRIPAVLKVNNKEILCSLLRGLFDTDGNIYFRSQGANKSYYPVISFTTISKILADDLIEILKMLGFKPNLYLDSKIKKKNPNPRYVVVLCGYANFELYKKLINTKQPKNIYKLKTWEEKFGK